VFNKYKLLVFFFKRHQYFTRKGERIERCKEKKDTKLAKDFCTLIKIDYICKEMVNV